VPFYLVLLGLASFTRARRIRRDPELPPAPSPARSAYLQGLLNNVLNPKLAVFYVASCRSSSGPVTLSF